MSSVKIFLLLFICFTSELIISEAKIFTTLLKSLNERGSSDVLVQFAGENSEVIEYVENHSFPSRSRKVQALTTGLKSLSSAMQGPIRDYLTLHNVQSESFWVSNQMVIRNATLPLLQRIELFPQVSKIRKLPEIELHPYLRSSASPPTKGLVQWGIAKIQADKVWSVLNVSGEGVVVANIDTGVQGTHEALKNNWRSDHGWFDPYSNTVFPEDKDGHGTHTMGTLIGSGGIGVAPNATWIACRGCNSLCDYAKVMACGEFILSPTNPDGTDPQPSMIPDIVNNSWGTLTGGEDWFNSTIEAWKAAGIMHTFSIGNQGPVCKSAKSPADQPSVFGVGSTDKNDRLSGFSSKGPATATMNVTDEKEYIKPDISAPGSDIYSAWIGSDDAYDTMSGTSMASPHVAGIMVLMISARRMKNTTDSMGIDQVKRLIERTADTKDLNIQLPNTGCSDFFSESAPFPNNEFGHGRVNAFKAVSASLSIS